MIKRTDPQVGRHVRRCDVRRQRVQEKQWLLVFSALGMHAEKDSRLLHEGRRTLSRPAAGRGNKEQVNTVLPLSFSRPLRVSLKPFHCELAARSFEQI